MKTTDRMVEKLRVILDGYKSGEHINLNRVSDKLSRLDNRIKMCNTRVGVLLSRHKDELVVHEKGKWFKK